MKWLLQILFAGMLAVVSSAADLSPAKAETFLGYIKDNEQVILVRVFDEHSQYLTNLTTGPLGIRFDWQGKVVQSIKGDWKVGEAIFFFIRLHEIPKGLLNENNRKDAPQLGSYIGQLMYLFIDTHDHKTPVELETGAEWRYEAELDALIKKSALR